MGISVTEREIQNIISSRYIQKVGKFVVKLGFVGEPAEECWMTEKQLSQLESQFERTKKGYSSKNAMVVGVWNDKGYYAYAKFISDNTPKPFKAPPQYDLSDLEDKDGN